MTLCSIQRKVCILTVPVTCQLKVHHFHPQREHTLSLLCFPLSLHSLDVGVIFPFQFFIFAQSVHNRLWDVQLVQFQHIFQPASQPTYYHELLRKSATWKVWEKVAQLPSRHAAICHLTNMANSTTMQNQFNIAFMDVICLVNLLLGWNLYLFQHFLINYTCLLEYYLCRYWRWRR